MKLGVIFPHTEIGTDPGAIREYAQAVEDIGYARLGAFDHVVGADTAYYVASRLRYTYKDLFHESMVLLGYLAGITQRLELATCVMILPPRQTALVAKQAAEVDVLSGGRLCLGIGTGWNEAEYEAMGGEFHTRGRRIEEQIALLRALWTQELVTFEGRWDKVTAVGLNPLPVQRPIPIWMGGDAEPVLRRVGHLADGWMCNRAAGGEERGMLERIRGYAREVGRDPETIGVEGRVGGRTTTPDDWVKVATSWREMGATYLSINTMRAGFNTVDQHINALRRFYEEVAAG